MISLNRLAALGAVAMTLGTSPSALAATAQADTRAFLRVDWPKRATYVGESVPVTVRAYYRGDTSVTVTGAPTLTSSEFTVTPSDPAEGRAEIGGTPYHVLTWKEHVSPVKTGHYAIEVSVPSTLEWRAAAPVRAAPSMPSDPFDLDADPFGDLSSGNVDPFRQMQQRMQQWMDRAASQEEVGPVQRKDVVLRTAAAKLDVLALPAAGRPPGYNGAVGHFAVTASAEPIHVRAGEPITLSIHVTGDGNFDRVDVAGIPESNDWKTYAPNATSGAGEKTFGQPIVPQHAGSLTIPAATLDYFDPDTAKYTSASTAPISVEVAPGTGAAPSSNGKIPTATTGPKLAPNLEAMGEPTAKLIPVFEERWFWAAQSLPLLGLAAIFFLGARRRRLRADPHRSLRRNAERAIRRHRAAMEHALRSGDAAAFFAAARGALQQRLGTRWGLEPAAISLSEVEARLDAAGVAKVRPIFDADAARFSNIGPRETELARWRPIVLEALSHTEAS